MSITAGPETPVPPPKGSAESLTGPEGHHPGQQAKSQAAQSSTWAQAPAPHPVRGSLGKFSRHARVLGRGAIPLQEKRQQT